MNASRVGPCGAANAWLHGPGRYECPYGCKPMMTQTHPKADRRLLENVKFSEICSCKVRVRVKQPTNSNLGGLKASPISMGGRVPVLSPNDLNSSQNFLKKKCQQLLCVSLWVLEYPYCNQTMTQTHPRSNSMFWKSQIFQNLQLPLNSLQIAISGVSRAHGLVVATCVPMSAQLSVLAPNDDPNSCHSWGENQNFEHF